MEHTCVEVQSCLPLLLNRSLEAHEVVFVSSHLQRCATCREEFRFVVQFQNVTKAHFSGAPGDAFYQTLWTEIRHAVAEETNVSRESEAALRDWVNVWLAPMAIAERALAIVRRTCTESITDAFKSAAPTLQS